MKRYSKSSSATAVQRGFTLIEVLVVVVILSILAAAIVPNIMDKPEKARMVTVKQDIQTLENALGLYNMDNSRYPTTDQGLEALVSKPTLAPIPKHWSKDGYLPRMPKDPWGNPYRYISPGQHSSKFDVYSLGPSGEPGADDVIGNWNLHEQE